MRLRTRPFCNCADRFSSRRSAVPVGQFSLSQLLCSNLQPPGAGEVSIVRKVCCFDRAPQRTIAVLAAGQGSGE